MDNFLKCLSFSSPEFNKRLRDIEAANNAALAEAAKAQEAAAAAAPPASAGKAAENAVQAGHGRHS